jgi:hypothetical protein
LESDNFTNLVDSIFQAKLFFTGRIVIVLSKIYRNQLLKYHNKCYNDLIILDAEDLEPEELKSYSYNQENIRSFRDSFWITTTTRFFYIKEAIKRLMGSVDQGDPEDPDEDPARNPDGLFFHMENDIMLYDPLNDLQYKKDHVYMVLDSPGRVIPSILCFCGLESSVLLCDHIIRTIHNNPGGFKNDMELLASFPNMIRLQCHPDHPDNNKIYDGAALGQYLGGIDYRNIPNTTGKNTGKNNLKYNNETVGFINETCDFKANNYTISHYYDNNGFKKYQINQKSITNLHIHSKVLGPFSSIFDIKYTDIITGDRIVNSCDLVITTNGINQFHQFTRKPSLMIILDQFNGPESLDLDKILKRYQYKKIFVYTHIIELFLNKSKVSKGNFVFYTHNSDHEFSDTVYESFKEKYPNSTFYAQNLSTNPQTDLSHKSVITDKTRVLPIGIANEMWEHGNLITLYESMIHAYRKQLPEGKGPGVVSGGPLVYTNLSSTHPDRTIVINELKSKRYPIITERVSHKEYIKQLSEHYFCICVRGNGIDTHRFWECLYLGTIPVIITNNDPKVINFVRSLKKLDLLFLDFPELPEYDFFTEQVYYDLIKNYVKQYNKYPLCSDALKMKYYSRDF